MRRRRCSKSCRGQISLGFTPYGDDLESWVARARGKGHEIMLQVPMEPFDFPNNDPGPQTLLTSLPAHANLDRLKWAMSRFGGYFGVTNYMGAKFTASEEALLRSSPRPRGAAWSSSTTAPRRGASWRSSRPRRVRLSAAPNS